MSIRNELLEQILVASLVTFDPTTDIAIQGILEGSSVAASQNPTGLGFANATQVEFGPAQFTGIDPVQLLADGTLRFNIVGTYRIKISLQFGRTSAAGVSEILFRVTDGAGNQLGRSIAALIDNANTDRYIENDAWLNIPVAPLEFKYELMRDASGNDSGGLIQVIPTNEGVGTWNTAPTATIRVERWTAP